MGAVNMAALPPLTDWFDLAEQKPWVPGAYEVEWWYEGQRAGAGWSFWDGERFLGTTSDFCRVESFGKAYGPTSSPIARWRGLSVDPAAAALPAPTPPLLAVISLSYGPEVQGHFTLTPAGAAAARALGTQRLNVIKAAIEGALRGVA